MVKRPRYAGYRAPGYPWTRWSDERLLDTRICDLKLKLKGCWIEDLIERLYGELDRRSLRVRPHVWLSDEWFSPDGIPGIAVPFYLAHPRLMRIERKRVFEVEGGPPEQCMKLLRHETGHVMQNAFRLHLRKRWQKIFGSAAKPYPAEYRPRPASKRFVQHLDLFYAQSHPTEDFAETFAVWLRPRSPWRKNYAKWPGALKKLEYVDELMKELAGEKPRVRSRARPDSVSQIRKTLREHYEERIERYQSHYPTIYDRDLKRIFSDDPKHKNSESAAAFLRRHRSEIRAMVSKWTGEYQVTLNAVFRDMIGRCRELDLRAVGSKRTLSMDFSILLTTRTIHYLHTSPEVHAL